MPYWSGEVDGNDYSFDTLSSMVVIIRRRLLDDLNKIVEKKYPEQPVGATLRCLRVIGEAFPKALELGFSKKHLSEVKEMFFLWYENVEDKIPKKFRDSVYESTYQEILLFEEYFSKKEGGG